MLCKVMLTVAIVGRNNTNRGIPPFINPGIMLAGAVTFPSPGGSQLGQHCVHNARVIGQQDGPEPGEQVTQDVQRLELYPHVNFLGRGQC